MSKEEKGEYINFIKEISLKAGKSLLSNFKIVTDGEVKTIKGDICTKADLDSEQIILNAIKKKFPDHEILSEESGLTKNSKGSKYKWYIDPLDGTINFAAKIPLWGTSIALAKSGELIASAIYLPALNELFWAQKGNGAFLGNERIFVNKEDDFYNFIFSCKGWPRGQDEKLKILELFSKFTEFSNSPRNFGSCVMALPYLAFGSFSVVLTWELNPWDIAAGILLVEEAGGKVTDLDGNPYNLEQKYVSILATNGKLHNETFKKVINPVLYKN